MGVGSDPHPPQALSWRPQHFVGFSHGNHQRCSGVLLLFDKRGQERGVVCCASSQLGDGLRQGVRMGGKQGCHTGAAARGRVCTELWRHRGCRAPGQEGGTQSS